MKNITTISKVDSLLLGILSRDGDMRVITALKIVQFEKPV